MLSRRLEMIVSLCGRGRCVADVGTDHGFVPIELLLGGQFERAIAMDIRPGPLSRAQEHIRERGLEGRIETRLSDGLQKLRPGEADTLVIAGMGGGLMASILGAAPETAASHKRLVLSPQSEIPFFRRFLQESGFHILREEMLREDGKYYVVMTAAPGPEEPWEEPELRYGRDLIRRRHPVLMQKLGAEIREKEVLRQRLAGVPGERAEDRLLEVERDLAVAREVLGRMEGETR